VAESHDAEAVALSVRLPSPRLYAWTVCVGPACPGCVFTGPTVVALKPSLGAALATDASVKTSAAKTFAFVKLIYIPDLPVSG
jgi:hypothetical protein